MARTAETNILLLHLRLYLQADGLERCPGPGAAVVSGLPGSWWFA
jgi:hypothetical protein